MFDGKEENVPTPLEVDSSASIPSQMQDMSAQEQFQDKLVSYSLFGLCIHIILVVVFALIVIVIDPIRPFIVSNSWCYWTMLGTVGFFVISAQLRKCGGPGGCCSEDHCRCCYYMNPCGHCCGISFLNKSAFSIHIIAGFYVTMIYGISIGVLCGGSSSGFNQAFIAFGIMQLVTFFGLGLAVFKIGLKKLTMWKRIAVAWLCCIVVIIICAIIMTDIPSAYMAIASGCGIFSGGLVAGCCCIEFDGDDFYLWYLGDNGDDYSINVFKVIRYIVDMHVWNIIIALEMLGGDD